MYGHGPSHMSQAERNYVDDALNRVERKRGLTPCIRERSKEDLGTQAEEDYGHADGNRSWQPRTAPHLSLRPHSGQNVEPRRISKPQ